MASVENDVVENLEEMKQALLEIFNDNYKKRKERSSQGLDSCRITDASIAESVGAYVNVERELKLARQKTTRTLEKRNASS